MFAESKVISADSHVVESWDLWQKRLPANYRDRAPRLVHDEDTDRLLCEDLPPSPVGLSAGALRSDDDLRREGRWDVDIPPACYDPDARLPYLEMDGVDGEVLYPTIALGFHPIADVDFKFALFRAYNDWLSDFCAVHPDRYKGIAVLGHNDVELAIAELRRAKQLGLVGVMLPTVPGTDTPPYYDAFYDPLWDAAVKEAMPIHFHAATSGNRAKAHDVSLGRNPLNIVNRVEYMQLMFLGFFFGGVFDRFPDLQVISAENNAGWLGDLLIRADNEFYHYKNLPRLGFKSEPTHAPSYYWRKNCKASFWNEPPVIATRNQIGTDNLMFQTDFPHSVSTYPDSLKILGELFEGVDPTDRDRMLYSNAAACYGF